MFAGTRVVEPDRVHVGAGSEQRAEERYFRVRRRPVVYWAPAVPRNTPPAQARAGPPAADQSLDLVDPDGIAEFRPGMQQGSERSVASSRRHLARSSYTAAADRCNFSVSSPTTRHSVQGFLLGRSQGGPQSWGR